MNRLSHFVAWAMLGLALASISSPAQPVYEPYTFTTFAGSAGPDSTDGMGGAARFNQPEGVTVDGSGNVYVADRLNNSIRRITPDGVVTTLAGRAGSDGSDDGIRSEARFFLPASLAAHHSGTVYLADTLNHTIRKVTPGGEVTTLAGLAGQTGSADGTGSEARFDSPYGIAVDPAGNVYVADSLNFTLRRVTPEGAVTTLAGQPGSWGSTDGTGGDARFWAPVGVAVDGAGNLYVVEGGNNTVRKITPTGVVTTLAGDAQAGPGSADGTGSDARFRSPGGVAVDSVGNVYVADTFNHTIRKVSSAGVVTTLAGRPGVYGSVDGPGDVARFYYPDDVAVDTAGNVYVADTRSNTIRKVTPAGVVSTLAGRASSLGFADGAGSAARFWYPEGLALNSGGTLYVSDWANRVIRKVTPAGMVTTLAGLAGEIGSADGTGAVARFGGPKGLAVDSTGNLYVADGDNHTLRKVTPDGVVTTLAGKSGTAGTADGMGDVARFRSPDGVAVNSADEIYVADTGNHTIRKVTPWGEVTTVAGLAGWHGSADGNGVVARFYSPRGIAVNGEGSLYVADSRNNAIRKLTAGGEVSTLAGLPQFDPLGGGVGGNADGTGSAARFFSPAGVAVNLAGEILVSDSGNNTVRKVTPAGVVTTLAGLTQRDEIGNPMGGSADGAGGEARFWDPVHMAVDGAGNIFVTDSGNHAIRKGFMASTIRSSEPGFGFNAGQFGFAYAGPTGRLVVVEASIDLLNWLPLETNTFNGVLNFNDSHTGAVSNRFYRSRVP